MPIIKLSHHAELHLTAWNIATSGKEFSGLGIICKEGDVFHVEDVFLLGVGSEVYTEFSPERQRDLPKEGLKLWFHRHPMGSGEPGPHNWSGTDEHTATREPLGAPPELVQWSVAIVRTPGGWVGRVDLHVPKSRTFHCAVEPRFPSKETVEEARQLLTPELNDYIQQLLQEYYALREARFPDRFRIYSEYETDGWQQDRFGWYEDEPELETSGLLSPCCSEVMEEVESGETCGVHCVAMACPRCEQIYVSINSEFPEFTERRVPEDRPARSSRKVKSRRDWRASFDSWLWKWNK